MTDAVERMRASKQAHVGQEKQDGQTAGILFATNTADYEDLLILRKVTVRYNDGDLLDMLRNEYSDRCDLREEDFKRYLFDDEDAAPSEFFIGAFVRAALEKLEFIAEQAVLPAKVHIMSYPLRCCPLDQPLREAVQKLGFNYDNTPEREAGIHQGAIVSIAKLENGDLDLFVEIPGGGKFSVPLTPDALLYASGMNTVELPF
jgi:hypothetical protein